jgi:hypothetical protein
MFGEVPAAKGLIINICGAVISLAFFDKLINSL